MRVKIRFPLAVPLVFLSGMSLLKFFAHLILALAASGVSAWAQASEVGIYRFVDAEGVVNFTNVPPDHRYRLLKGAANTRPPNTGSITAYADAERLRYSNQIQDAAHASHIEPALIHAVISAESGYNPFARSNRGAVGLMQLTPETAIHYGVTNRLDPAQNIKAGTRYLCDLLGMFHNDLQLALAAYNAGEQAVVKHGNRIPPFRETLDYVPRVLAYYKAYRTKS